MASYTDQIPQFTPYIQQLPVEAMVQVGMEKQRRYDEGIQKIQTNIDNVAGIAVARPQDREYLQSKLNELGSKLKTVAAGDFSNYQLVNSVGGMAKQIGKDELIRASVQSASNIKKQQELMDEEKKKGNLTPDNLLKYNKGLQAYYSAGLKDESGKPYTFNGSYTPHFDVDKFTKETFDAVKPDGYSFEQLYETDTKGMPLKDKNGNYIPSKIATVLDQEGRFPKTVLATLSQIFSDPRVKQQLQITGEYNYRTYTPDMLIKKIGQVTNNQIQGLEDQLRELNLKKAAKEDVDDQIAATEKAITQSKASFAEVSALAQENPDAIRGSIHMNDVQNNYTTMYGTIKEKRSVKKSELFDINFRLEQERTDNYFKSQDLRIKLDNLAETKRANRSKETLEEAEFKLKYPSATVEYGAVPTGALNSNVAFDEAYSKGATVYGEAVNNLLLDTNLNNPTNKATLSKLMQTMPEPEAKEKLIEMLAKTSGETPQEFRSRWFKKSLIYLNDNPEKLTPSVAASVSSAQNAQNYFATLSDAKKTIDAKSPEDYKGIVATLKPISYDTRNKFQKLTGAEGGRITITPQMQYDIALALSGDNMTQGPEMKTQARLAQKRLIDQGIDKETMENIANDMMAAPVSSEGRLKSTITKSLGGILPFDIALAESFIKGDLAKILPEQVLRARVSPEQSAFRNLITTVSNPSAVLNLEKRAKAIDSIWQFNPTAKTGIFTGEEKVDKVYRENIGRFIGSYAQLGANESPGFVQNAPAMMDIIKNPEKGSVELTAKKDEASGQVSQALKFYNDKSQFVGEVTIAPDEAAAINKYPSSFFTVPGVKSAEIRFNSTGNGTTSTSGEVENPSTYKSGDVLYNKNQFPLLKGLPKTIDVKANLSSSTYYDQDGNPSTRYYNHIYIKNGAEPAFIKTFDVPKPNIDQSIQGLNGISPQLIQQIIAENKK